MDIVIYGAQGIALGTYYAVRSLYPERKVPCFLVTERGINADTLAGMPVVELKEFLKRYSVEDRARFEILIATPESVMGEIEATLRQFGFPNFKRMDSASWSALMEQYYTKEKRFLPLSALPDGDTMPDLTIYMARSHKDQQIKSTDYPIPVWMEQIQVGAELTSERIASVLDNEGDSISYKNGNYSELTALYWIWKNAVAVPASTERYIGLSHYRRFLDIKREDLKKLLINDVDAVFTYPMIYEPDIEAHHERYLKKVDWDAVLKALQELQPEYAKVFPEILSQEFFINYNIFFARENVLVQYCEWLFPILERVEEYSSPKGFERNDRYIGYIGETLMTLYFFANLKGLRIHYTGCKFLV